MSFSLRSLRIALFAFLFAALALPTAEAQISDNHKPNIFADEFTPKGANFGWKEGYTVPNLDFNDINNKKLKLYDLLEKGAVVLEFWSMDCQSCNANKKYLKSFYKMYPIEVIGVTTDPYPNEVRKQLDSQGVQWTNIIDDNTNFGGQTFVEAQGMGTPAFIVIMPDKTVGQVFYQPEDVKKLGVYLQQNVAK